jgi:hypothetical protein
LDVEKVVDALFGEECRLKAGRDGGFTATQNLMLRWLRRRKLRSTQPCSVAVAGRLHVIPSRWRERCVQLQPQAVPLRCHDGKPHTSNGRDVHGFTRHACERLFLNDKFTSKQFKQKNNACWEPPNKQKKQEFEDCGIQFFFSSDF